MRYLSLGLDVQQVMNREADRDDQRHDTEELKAMQDEIVRLNQAELEAIQELKQHALIAQQQMELLEQFPQKIDETPKIYITTLNNILLSHIHTHNYENFDKILAKLRSFPLKSLNQIIHFCLGFFSYCFSSTLINMS